MSNQVQTVEFTPAHVALVGTTLTEKRVDLIKGASLAATTYLVDRKGKVGQAARSALSGTGLQMIAKAALMGNYRPFAEALAVTLGESVVIRSRGSFDAIGDMLDARVLDLKDAGYKVKDGIETETPKRRTLMQARSLYETVQAVCAAAAAASTERIENASAE